MTTKEYLKQYKRMTEILRQIDSEISALEIEIDSVSVGDGIGGGNPNRTEALALRLVEMKSRRERLRLKAWAKREEVEDVILKVSDPVYGRLLYDRYILFMGWSEITDDLHYMDDSHVRGRLHSKALMSAANYIPNEEGQHHDDQQILDPVAIPTCSGRI